MIRGKALVLGDEVNTDELHPSRFYSLDDAKVRSGFLKAVDGPQDRGERPVAGCIVVAGTSFGIGSSRETGARVFQLAGIQAVVAASFARIFWRNVLNLGLPAFECPALAAIRPGDGEPVTLSATELTFGGRSYPLVALDPHWQAVLDAGGLASFLGLDA